MEKGCKRRGGVAVAIVTVSAVLIAITAIILLIAKLAGKEYRADGGCCGDEDDFEDDFDDEDDNTETSAAESGSSADENGCQYTNDRDFA
jgi:hypothetical protein